MAGGSDDATMMGEPGVPCAVCGDGGRRRAVLVLSGRRVGAGPEAEGPPRAPQGVRVERGAPGPWPRAIHPPRGTRSQVAQARRPSRCSARPRACAFTWHDDMLHACPPSPPPGLPACTMHHANAPSI